MRSADAVEDGVKLVISLMKRRLHAAPDSLARTLVSLRFHSHTNPLLFVCVCVCDSVDRQLSSDRREEGREGGRQ